MHSLQRMQLSADLKAVSPLVRLIYQLLGSSDQVCPLHCLESMFKFKKYLVFRTRRIPIVWNLFCAKFNEFLILRTLVYPWVYVYNKLSGTCVFSFVFDILNNEHKSFFWYFILDFFFNFSTLAFKLILVIPNVQKSYYWFYKVNQREMTTMKALSVYQ